VGRLKVYGKKINTKCEKSLIERNFEWAHNYIEEERKQRQLKDQQKKEKEETKKLQDKFGKRK